MRVPTVKIKHADGTILVINETDWAMGSLPGINLGSSWTRISETTGDGDEFVKESIAMRAAMDNQLAIAEDVEKRARIKARNSSSSKVKDKEAK